MQIEWNWKKVAIIGAAVVVVLGSNAATYYALWKPRSESAADAYIKQISTLQATVDQLGPMTDVWTVSLSGQGVVAGKEVKTEDLEIKQVPYSFVNENYVLDPSELKGTFYKLNLQPGTPLNKDLVMSEPLDDTTREYDILASMPIGLKIGDYVDLRLVYPRAEDYVVLSHKRIKAINGTTVKFDLNEEEIHLYQASLVDNFIQKERGSDLYLAKYTDPGVQKEAKKYYAVPKNVETVMSIDPNLVNKINSGINDGIRAMIDSGVSKTTDEDASAIAAGRSESKSKVDQGATELAQKRTEQEAAEGQINTETPTVTDTTGTTGTPVGTGTEEPLVVEEGVVE